jgi:ubiquilin
MQTNILYFCILINLQIEITEGNTVHVVRSGTNRAPAKQSQQQEQEPIPPIPATPSPANLPGLLNNTSDIMNPFSGGDGMGMPNMDPEVVRQMMDSPFMQSLLDNPGK